MPIASVRVLLCRSATNTAFLPRNAELSLPFSPPLPSTGSEFPTVHVCIEAGARKEPDGAVLDGGAWLDRRTRFETFDDPVDAMLARRESELAVSCDPRVMHRVVLEILTRYQRGVRRRNEASVGAAFDALLRIHCGLHDMTKPLVVADYRHALDAWQWVLRLDPEAGAELQAAALLHDVERLESEADARIEQHAPDYHRFKAAHARRGAEVAAQVALASGMAAPSARRIAALVERHESPGGVEAPDADRALLNDADALSFFSQNSAGYLDYFGVQQTRKKLRYTWERMGQRARDRIAWVRLRSDVEALWRDLRSEDSGAHSERQAALTEEL